ncbi:MAG: outer membrane lipoprotein carrier protein LolA [Candidatus Cryptobacteroides sp.]
MKIRRIILLLVLSGLQCLELFARDTEAFDSLYARMSSSCVSMNYSFVYQDRTKVVGEGSLVSQGAAFRMQGNGLEVYCDGSTVWTLDKESREVVVDCVSDGSFDLSNPALLFTGLRENFTISEAIASGAVMTYVLTPVTATGIKSCIVKIADGKLHSGVFDFDGKTLAITVSAMSFGPLQPLSAFTFDPSALSSDYIITDLR